MSITKLPQWRPLRQHADEIGDRHLRALFAGEPSRGERFIDEAAGLYLDYSKQRVTGEALRHYSRHDLAFRFVSNVDGTDFVEATP